MVTTLVGFLGISALVICTPGQDTALTIRNTLAGGRASGIGTAAGVALGQVVWALAASVGLAALLAASEPAFLALRLAGAAYLVLLGLQTLWAALRRPGERALVPGRAITPGPAARQGLLSNLGNPKMAAFFTSLLPQFADSFAGLLALGFVFSLLTFVWLTGYAFAVTKASALLLRPRVRRVLDAVTGAVLVALGLRLATDR
ncbi:MAG TPA: LysE family translocator [Gaiellaceae bacterium]|nr:LysE family translocator [Gaiellaceae bacterium]